MSRPIVRLLALALAACLALEAAAQRPPPTPRVEVHPPSDRPVEHSDGLPGRTSGSRQPIPPVTMPDGRTLAKRDIDSELSKLGPDAERVSADFARVVSGGRPTMAELAEFARKAAGERIRVPLAEGMPHVVVQRPASVAFDPIAAHTIARATAALQRSVDRDAFVLLPLVFSTAAKAKLAEIPLVHQARDPFIEALKAANFDELDIRMFAGLSGQTVAVVGHVTIHENQASFEIRQGDRRRYLPLEQLRMAATRWRFNFVPLGCETAGIDSVGTATRINDVDALNAFQKARRTGGATTYLQLLADLSSADVQIMIDLAKLTNEAIMPIDPLKPEPAVAGRRAGLPSSSGSSQPATFLTLNDAVVISNSVSPALLARSQFFFAHLLPRLPEIWLIGFSLLAGIGLLGMIGESLLLRQLPPGERVGDAVLLTLGALLMSGGAVGLFSYWDDSFLPLLVGTLACWGVPIGLKEKFPDHRLARRLAVVVCLWTSLPPLFKVAVSVSIWTGLLLYPEKFAYWSWHD